MHLSDGVVSPSVLFVGTGLAILATAQGLRSLSAERLPLAALMAAALFVAGTIHVPVGIGSVHLVLNGLAGVLLGWVVFPVILVGLILQALLLSFGGFSVLGVNLLILALPGVIARAVLVPWLRRGRLTASSAGGLAAAIAIVGAVALTAAVLAMSAGSAFRSLIVVIAAAQLPVLIVDIVVSALVLGMMTRAVPGLLHSALER